MRWLLAALLAMAGPVRAEGERAGDFDYYVLALSWNASWCALEGDARGADQCDARHDLGFTLHGLWPEYEDGWPSYCRTGARDPSRAETAAMADIMGSGGLAWYQWKKHGRCSGLSAENYFKAARSAFEAVDQPPVFGKLPGRVRIAPDVVEAAFLEVNPGLEADGVTVTCKGGLIQEVRVCLTKELEPRVCAPDARRDCSGMAEMDAVR